MPFDATPTPRTSIADKMRAILDRGWCKNWLRDPFGGTAHCLMGAFLEANGLYDSYQNERRGATIDEVAALFARYNAREDVIALSEAVAVVSPYHKRMRHHQTHWNRIATFNNDPATSYDDIVRVLDEFAARTATKEMEPCLSME